MQGELESAIERIVGESVELTVAGRTDAGVHATGQVASFEHERELELDEPLCSAWSPPFS